MIRNGVAEYVRIRQQPTALQAVGDSRLFDLERTLREHGFSVHRVTDMAGWLAYHAAFVACVAAALYRCGGDAARLATDQRILTLMGAAVTEAFTTLRKTGITGLPRNLAILPSRHAEAEMRALGGQVAGRIGSDPRATHVRELLSPERELS